MSEWKRRSPEWIKENPGKSYLYKDIKPLVVMPDVVVTSKYVNSYKANRKVFPGQCGIYVVVCEVEKYVYVGQSMNVGVRLRSHKLAILSKDYDGSMYHKMREHSNANGGISSFEFKTHKLCDMCDLDEEESRGMLHYAQRGYKLYNKVITIVDQSVYCPDNYRHIVTEVIEKLQVKSGFDEALASLISLHA